MADAAITVPVEPVSEDARRLAACAGTRVSKGNPICTGPQSPRLMKSGRAIEKEVRGQVVFRVIREHRRGHGIGRTIHEAPICA